MSSIDQHMTSYYKNYYFSKIRICKFYHKCEAYKMWPGAVWFLNAISVTNNGNNVNNAQLYQA